MRGGVGVSVQDRGKGMSPEVLRHALLPFYSTKKAGSGLGLALARAIAHGHGGEVLVRSEPGAGSTFELVLPAAAPPSVVPAEITTPAPAGDPCGNMRT